jgi:hypothetical protein
MTDDQCEAFEQEIAAELAAQPTKKAKRHRAA